MNIKIQKLLDMLREMESCLVAFSGGVANNSCIVEMVRRRLNNVQVVVPENPSIIGALGASIQAGLAR